MRLEKEIAEQLEILVFVVHDLVLLNVVQEDVRGFHDDLREVIAILAVLDYFTDFSLFVYALAARLDRRALSQHFLPVELVIVEAVHFV